jgi:hypothetical protein
VVGGRGRQRKAVFSFRSTLICRRVKARPADRNLGKGRSAAGLHASRDSFYRTARGRRQLRTGVIPLTLLPRQCPKCRRATIIGHGLRLRSAHDDRHEYIRVRRGRCPLCRVTFTILPDWLVPSGRYSLRCRQQACERLAVGFTVEEAAPDCRDPTRSPDATTLRRWGQRRLLSIWCALAAGLDRFLRPPTIVAWDLRAARRILPNEARSP